MINTKIKFLVLFHCLLIYFSVVQAQTKLESSVNIHNGIIIFHQKNIGHLTESYPVGLSASIYKQHIGDKGWGKVYNFPFSGVTFQYLDYNNRIIGKSLGILPNVRLPIKRRKHSSLELKAGTGIAIHTSPFDIEKNPRNLFFSSKIGFGMLLGLLYSHQIHKKLRFSMGLEITHFSNGAFSLPNAGVNVPNISLGIHYTPKEDNLTFKHAIKPFSKKTQLHIVWANSLVERNPGQDYKHYIFQLTGYGQKQINNKSALQMGIDFSANTANKSRIQEKASQDSNYQSKDYKRVAILIGHELLGGKVGFISQLGIYVYAPFNFEERAIFERYGVKYYFHQTFFGQFAFKTHLAVAECIEFAFGARF